MKRVAMKTQSLVKSFFSALLKFFTEEESKKDKVQTEVPCEKEETTPIPCGKETRKQISLERMEEFCRENGFFHDSVTKDIIDPKSLYFYVIKGERRFIIQKTGEQEEVLATLARDRAKRKARERQQKKHSPLNL